MQNRNGYFGGFALLLTLGLAGCGGAEGTSGGDSPHPRALVGHWRAGADARSSTRAEDFELRSDGTATLNRSIEGRSQVAAYRCTWSVQGQARPAQDDPWFLVRDCHRVAGPGSVSSAEALDFELTFTDAVPIVDLQPSAFVAERADQSQLEYERIDPQ